MEFLTGSDSGEREILYYEAKETVEEIGKLMKQIGTDIKKEEIV